MLGPLGPGPERWKARSGLSYERRHHTQEHGSLAGDGGMPIIAAVGGAFVAYGVDGEDLGWVGRDLYSEDLACNPMG